MAKKLNLIILLGLTIVAMQLKAIEPYKPQTADPVLEPWRWTDFPEFDTIRISCLAKSKDGGLWMGIGNKAVYYDGYKTVQHLPDSTTIHALAFENNNNLLVSTDKGIYRYIQGDFRKILNLNFTGQQNFITDKDENVWIGSDFGLIEITTQKIFCLNPEGFFEIDDSGHVLNILQFERANDYRQNSIKEIKFPVYNLSINQEQKVWMVVNFNDKNIATTDITEKTKKTSWKYIKSPQLPYYDISGICECSNSLWVTSGNANIALLKYTISEDKWNSVNLKEFGGDNVQTSITETKDGTVWIGGHSKLYALRSSGWKVYQYPDVALPLSYIEIYLDAQEDFFVFGANGSLMKLDISTKTYNTFLGLNFNCNTPDGKFWFTTNTGKVVVCDSLLQNFQTYSVSDNLMEMAMSLHYSKNSGLWAAGSHQRKAAIARFADGQWKLKIFPELYLGIAYNGICDLGDTAVAFPVNGILQLNNTNYQGGFIEFNYKKSTWLNFTKDKVPQRIPTIGQTSDGKLWFSGNEFTMFDGKQNRKVELPAKSLSWTDDIGITPSDHIWVAQGGTGLFYNDGEKWTRFTTFNGLASNMVTNLLIENDSTIYIASDKGISFFDGKQFTPQVINSDLTIQRERGYLRKSNDGALWINQGTREWYLYDFKNAIESPSIFKTTFYQKDSHPPKTTIAFSDHEISSSGNVIITYNGIDYWNRTQTGKIQFSHRLNHNAWSPFSEEKSSVFLDLKAGKYVLEVRSRDLDNNIELKPAQISFIILPPVYRRAWFILTILTFLGIIIWLLIRLYARNKQIHELDQLKLRLFTDISHELKTPLTLISLPLQKLIDKAKKQDESQSSLELIYNNVQRLNNLVNQVVDFRRLEAGKIQLELSPGDLILQLRNISNYYAPLAHEKNILFVFKSDLQDFWAKYDADKLEKIVVNLLSNAFKFTPENEKVELIVKIDQLNSKLQLWVNDSGPGIPKEMQQNVFDRFYRLRSEKSTRIPGSGIGLSLVKELVNLHRGTIDVISDGIHGTSFEVELPLIPTNKSEEPATQPKNNFDLSKYENTPKAIVLLIEDEEPMLRFITEELGKYFSVKGVSSVEKAFEWLTNEMPELIISDVMLPGMTGLDFCRKLKENNLTSHLPVILLTARDSEEDIVEGLGSGADDYITKPFRMNELVARCFNLIENRRRQKERFADQDELELTSFTQNSADHDFLNKAIGIVFENLDNSEFDVPNFCQQINMSKTLLYSKLKSLTGQSATEFVRNIRLKEAKKLLLNNRHQHTIAEISYKVGFNDPLYFSRCFRKYFGIPPSEIGKELKIKE